MDTALSMSATDTGIDRFTPVIGQRRGLPAPPAMPTAAPNSTSAAPATPAAEPFDSQEMLRAVDRRINRSRVRALGVEVLQSDEDGFKAGTPYVLIGCLSVDDCEYAQECLGLRCGNSADHWQNGWRVVSGKWKRTPSSGVRKLTRMLQFRVFSISPLPPAVSKEERMQLWNEAFENADARGVTGGFRKLAANSFIEQLWDRNDGQTWSGRVSA